MQDLLNVRIAFKVPKLASQRMHLTLASTLPIIHFLSHSLSIIILPSFLRLRKFTLDLNYTKFFSTSFQYQKLVRQLLFLLLKESLEPSTRSWNISQKCICGLRLNCLIFIILHASAMSSFRAQPLHDSLPGRQKILASSQTYRMTF